MRIDIIGGPDTGKSFTFDADTSVLLGRDFTADVPLRDVECSRRHARIYLDDRTYRIEDLGSTNGIRVNDRWCTSADLVLGDTIALGRTSLQVTDIPAAMGLSTRLRMRDENDSVLVALDHNTADFLSTTAVPIQPTDSEEERRVLREICDISSMVAASHVVQTSLDQIVRRSLRSLDADTACILVRVEDGDWVIRAADNRNGSAEDVTVSRTIVNRALEEGVAILSSDPLTDERFSPSQSIFGQKLASAICSPVKVNDAFEGVFFLDRRRRRAAFQPIDLRFAATMGNLVGLLLENERLQNESRGQQRLATIGEVIAGLAHYAKNIIQGMHFSSTTLKLAMERKEYGNVGVYLETLMSQERRMSSLVMDMLSYSREREPERAPVDVRALVDEVVKPYENELRENGVDVTVACDVDSPVLSADELALHRVFLNLLTNAIDAVSEGERDRRIAVHIDRDGETPGLRVRFRDSGTGIPADELPKVFDVFFSTKGSAGTGLGLAVVHKTISEHGGEITVDSREGEWTEFTVLLPQADREVTQ